jgi:hypothetical protein
MTDVNQDVWDFLDRHLTSIFSRDWATYESTTSDDLTLYEWWVTPHRQHGLDFHRFMIENAWAGDVKTWRYDLLEKHCQRFADTAIVTYTFMLSQVTEQGIKHRTHNECRVLRRHGEHWQVVHVHKSPATPETDQAPNTK